MALTTKMVNSLKGQKNRGSISIFCEGAVQDTHYSTINYSLIISLEQPEAESWVSKCFSSEAQSIRPNN